MNMNLITKTVVAAVCDFYHELDSCPDLRPGGHADGLFGRLVRLVLTASDDDAHRVLTDPDVCALMPRLRELCARGEYELEAHWAERIGTSPHPHADLNEFPYLDNYRLLSRMEADVITSVADGPLRSVAFGGCGPLPLSSLCYTHELGVQVDNIDHDPAVIYAARRVAKALGRDDLRFHLADVASADLRSYDVVVLAALVGATAGEKATLVRQVAASMTPGALLLVRSTRGMRTLLYPDVDLEPVPGLDVLTAVHPTGEVINSALVARVNTGESALAVPVARTGREA